LKALDSLNKYVPKHRIVIAREMTKQFEEFIEGHPIDIISYFEKDPVRTKGEFVVIVKP